MESELPALVESLRTGANRLTADLSLLEGDMGDLYGVGRAAGRRRRPRRCRRAEPVAAAARSRRRSRRGEATEEFDEVARPSRRGRTLAVEPETTRHGAATAAADEDIEGARLIALNMALNGQSREETDRYLAENFQLGDRAALLDEVYSTVEG